MRSFNTAGPIRREEHYHVPPLGPDRLDADEVRLLIRQRKYFVLHAPRQTGKTSALLALRDELNAAGEVRCAYVNVEVGQTAREDVAAGMRAILSALASGARHASGDEWLAATWPGILERAGPHDALRETLTRWAESEAKPIVLLIDEIDALVGDTLLAVLRQRPGV
ncbi:MAG: ATP-binding protein [Acidobacteria bacterium]|nr:ATP-binding protein [Acidobacteriota bacterium]